MLQISLFHIQAHCVLSLVIRLLILSGLWTELVIWPSDAVVITVPLLTQLMMTS